MILYQINQKNTSKLFGDVMQHYIFKEKVSLNFVVLFSFDALLASFKDIELVHSR